MNIRDLTCEDFTQIFTLCAISLIALYLIFNIAIEAFHVASGPRFNDFDNYYYSAIRVLNNGYLYTGIEPDHKFMYPPIAVLPFIPFTVLSLTGAGLLWNATSLMFLLMCVQVLVKRLAAEQGIELSIIELGVVFVCVLGFAPMLVVLRAGQATSLPVGIICLSTAYMLLKGDRRESSIASLLLPVASLIKPYYVPSGAYLLQNTKRFIYGIASGLTIVAFSILLFGVSENEAYLKNVLFADGSLVYSTPPDQWNAAIYAPLYVFGTYAEPLRVSIILIVVSFVLFNAYQGNTRVEVGLLGIAIVPIATPVGVDSMAILIPTYLVLFTRYWNDLSVRSGLFLSVLLIEAHPYTIELLTKYGPGAINLHPTVWETVYTVVPFIQPALWGHLILLSLICYLGIVPSPETVEQTK